MEETKGKLWKEIEEGGGINARTKRRNDRLDKKEHNEMHVLE